MGTGIQQGRTEGRRWAGAIITAVLVWAGLAGVGFTPEWAQPVAALAAAALWLVSADLAAMLVLAVFALPLLAASPVLGVTFLALGIVSLRYLGSRGGAPLLIVLGAFAGVTFGPAWAVAALAGYVLGAGEGALAAALSCMAVQAYGLALGLPALGATVTGGDAPLLRLGESGTNLLSFAWLASAVGEIDAGAVEKAIDIMTKPGHPMALVLQPLAWAAAAAVAGSLAAYLRGGRRKSLAPVAAALGALVPGVALTAIFPVLDVPVRVPVLISSAMTSAVVAGHIALAWEYLARTEVAPESAAGAGATVVQEDADVDELLTLIATAEDKLSAQHTAH
ncbi:MAG TPA: hypothetical protein VLA05_10830, partial [Coriobacteriia bacterium]|nr:hypothetical protein [Coriobacteriia bacterium]